MTLWNIIIRILTYGNLANRTNLRHQDSDVSEVDSVMRRFKKIVGGLIEEFLKHIPVDVSDNQTYFHRLQLKRYVIIHINNIFIVLNSCMNMVKYPNT